MMLKIESNQNKIQRYFLILPVIFTLFIAGGAFLGIQLSNIWGISDSITWPIIFSTIGFAISIVISILISKR